MYITVGVVGVVVVVVVVVVIIITTIIVIIIIVILFSAVNIAITSYTTQHCNTDI